MDIDLTRMIPHCGILAGLLLVVAVLPLIAQDRILEVVAILLHSHSLFMTLAVLPHIHQSAKNLYEAKFNISFTFSLRRLIDNQIALYY